MTTTTNTTTAKSSETANRSSTATTLSTRRRLAFYAPVTLGAIGMLAFFGLVTPILRFGVLSWVNPQAVAGHVVHSVADSSLLLLPIIGLALQFVGPRRRAAGVQAAILVMGVVTAVTAVALPQFAPVMGLFLLLSLAAGALHPARGQVFGLRGPISYWGVALSGVALAASIGFIVQHMQLQMTAGPADEHAQFGHWAMTAALALSVPLLGALGSLGNAGRRIPAVGAAVLAILYGLASILHPVMASSLGVTGGAIALLWAALYLVATERRRERA